MECERFFLVKVTSFLWCVMCGNTHFTVTSYMPVVLFAQLWRIETAQIKNK